MIDALRVRSYSSRVQAGLEKLLIIQDRDQKIRQFQAEAKTLPMQRKNLEGQLAVAAANLEAAKQRGKHLEVDRKNLELDVGTRQASIARLKTQQYETRKNDEFAAMGHEIQRYEKEIAALEDRELELMVQADGVKAEVATEEKTAAARRESVNRQLAALEEKGKVLQSRLDEIVADRAKLAAEVDEDVLERYERLFASKGDVAIVAVEHGVCTGCHMKLTTQTVVRARGGSEIVSCEQCGRILYASE